jgi:imidazolonepropionase-like amidohydrolase/ABC-type multidrug transport system permease subunit
MKAYLALIRIEMKLALRNRSALFFNYAFPLIFFFIFAQSFHAEQGGAILQVVAMVATIGVIGNGLFGAGMRAVQEREQGILRRYKVTPITPVPLLVSSIVTGVIIYVPFIALMLFLGKTIYHMPMPAQVGSLFVFVIFGVAAFRSIGLIIAAVVNSMQESVILVQITYFAMLFLSGASFPISIFPNWLQNVTQFIPATYLVSGFQGILLRNESIAQNKTAVLALIVTAAVAMFVATKIFRWEKEEKVRNSAKLWILAVLVPFFVMGTYQAYTKDNVEKARIDTRVLRRSRNFLYRNARIFVGDGKVIENGAVLIKNGKFEEIYEGAGPDPKSVNAEAVEAAGKTILPGLIDVHVHLSAPGGVADETYKMDGKMFERKLAGYLYSGVTAVKSAGDPVELELKTKAMVNSGQRLGAEFFICGPLFTAEGGHGTEYFKQVPEKFRAQAQNSFARTPKTAEEARQQVDALKKQGVDGIKAVLQGGMAGYAFNRLDLGVLRAIFAESKAQALPLTVHTGEAKDVADALEAGTNGIEHGSLRDAIPVELFARMVKDGVFYDPTMSVFEGLEQLSERKSTLFNRSLVQQTQTKEMLAATRKMLATKPSPAPFEANREIAMANLRAAYKAGVILVTGSDAGNPMVFHGPTVQREMELWVEAGLPATVALQAATANAARFLRVENRLGMIKKGFEATMILVDGNPIQDIRLMESISSVMFKGERVDRSELFDQE